jgi:opacity protein-like surface antigen
MKMKSTLTAFALALAFAALPASAQAPAPEDGVFVASAGLVFAQGDAQTLTNKVGGGYSFEVGYQIHPKDFGPSVLIFGGYERLPEGPSTDARPSYSLVGQITQKDGNGTLGDQGVKIGWRLGVSYLVNSQWSVDLKYTLTEWGGGPTGTATAYRPAYLSVMGTYRF